MLRYSELIRTTLDKMDGYHIVGVYVIAYLGRVVYVGMSNYDVSARLFNHWYIRHKKPLGEWLEKMQLDFENIRLDILTPPQVENIDYWLRTVESALCKKFRPLFNDKLNKTE